MIKYNVKNEKGISLATLVITVVLLMIITTILATNSYDSLQLSKLNKLSNDIQALEDRIASYYIQKEELPIDKSRKYTKSDLKDIKDLAKGDGDEYYLLNLSMLDNLSLNYPRAKYIINVQSHVVYNMEGINYHGTIYHTYKNS